MDKIRLAKRVAEVAVQIEPLKKETRNNDAGFNFVSIDDYYSKVANFVMAEGLYWKLTEAHCQALNTGDILTTYKASVFDFVNFLADEDYCNITILHPAQGAQTAGSSQSYAEKIFMRQAFKIVTGEPDADYFARKKGPVQAVADKAAQKATAQRAEAKPRDPEPKQEPAKTEETVAEKSYIPASKMDDAALEALGYDIMDEFSAAGKAEDLKIIMMRRAEDLAVLKERMPNINSQVVDAYKTAQEKFK